MNRFAKFSFLIISVGLLCLTMKAQVGGQKSNTSDLLSAMERTQKKIEAGDLKSALADANEAIKLSRDFKDKEIKAAVFLLRGAVFQAKLDITRAITDYSTAIRINDKYADAYEARAELFLEKEEYGKARADAEKALEINPRLSHCYAILSGVSVVSDQFEQSIEQANKALEADKTDSLALKYRGISHVQLDQHKLGLADLDKFLQIYPDDIFALLHRILANTGLQNWQNVIEDANVFIKTDPKFANVYGLRALANLMLEKDFEQIVSDFNASQKFDSVQFDSDDHRFRAMAYRRLGKDKEAEADEKKAKELDAKKNNR